MQKKQMEESEGLVIHEKTTGSLEDAINECLDSAVKQIDKMFILVCEARSAYISASEYHKKEDWVGSHNSRLIGTTKLNELQDLLTGSLTTDE